MNSEDPDAQVKMRKENLYDAYRHRMVHEGGVTIPKLIME
jgi:hypothetical protein